MNKEEPFFGICPVYNEKATVTVKISGFKNPNDLQPIGKSYGFKCSLLSHGETCPRVDCHLIPKNSQPR